MGIDTFFYKKLVCVPLNIVLYNVFSGGSKGPNIYGVEPWHFYIRNLALNFNVWFFLAMAALPLLLFQHVIRQKSISKQTLLRGVVFVSPFYLWLGIFTLQSHKEERFMYPAYPALALNAAMSLHVLLANFGSADPRDLVSKIPPKLKLAVVSLFVLGSFDLGALRTIGVMTAYSAPLSVYKPLNKEGATKPGDHVCLGKEWYRFPSSYFLPDQVRAKFIKSEFSGLLPGEFSEANVGFGFFPGTWLMPSGMNDENKEDPGKYVSLAQAHPTFTTANPSTDRPRALQIPRRLPSPKCAIHLPRTQLHLRHRDLGKDDLQALLGRRPHFHAWPSALGSGLALHSAALPAQVGRILPSASQRPKRKK